MPPGEGRAVDRPLKEQEEAVASFLATALPDGGEAIRTQLKAGRVLSEGSCCASVHIYAHTDDSRPAPVERATVIEAGWTSEPHRFIRLAIAATGWISHLELVHEEEAEGPREFPPPSELRPPELRPY
jgi:hypothetical protein